jgi:hypothetical protein
MVIGMYWIIVRKHWVDNMKEDCDCGCNDPVATTPQEMLEFLAHRLEYAGVSDSVAKYYARDIRLILKEYFGVPWCLEKN